MTWKREAKTYEMYTANYKQSKSELLFKQQSVTPPVNIVAIDFSASKQVLKTALVGLGVSAVSAGIAAVMNLEEKNNDI